MAILESLLLDVTFPGPVSLVQKVIAMAKMLLHLLDPDFEVNVSQLAQEIGVSRETLYQWGYRAIAVVGMACIPDRPGPKPIEKAPSQWQERIAHLEEKIRHFQHLSDHLRFENQWLRARMARLTVERKQLVDLAIIVLRMSGKVSYRGIQECIRYLLGVHVPLATIEAQLTVAAQRAEGVLPSLLSSVRVALASLDEIYLKEKGKRIYGLLVVDLPSRAIVTLKRATDRTSDTWKGVVEAIPQAQTTLQGLVSDIARAYPALVRKLGAAWKRSLVHQLCNVHAMRKIHKLTSLALQPYRQARERYKKAKKALAAAPHDPEAWSEYWAARQLRNFHRRMLQYVLTLKGQLLDALRQPTREAAQQALDQVLARLAALPSDYQPFAQEVIGFIHRHGEKLLAHYDVPGLDWTTNSAESAFSVLRRFVTVFKAFSSQEGVQRFFALFVLYYNLKPQRYADGQVIAPLERAGAKLEGNYLHYLGYETLQEIIQYSTLERQVQQQSQEAVLQLSTEFTALALTA
jgi:transposase-like protein